MLLNLKCKTPQIQQDRAANVSLASKTSFHPVVKYDTVDVLVVNEEFLNLIPQMNVSANDISFALEVRLSYHVNFVLR